MSVKKNTPLVSDHWLLGCIKTFPKDPLQFMEDKLKEHGDFLRINMLVKKLYITSNPDVIKHILQTNQKNYIKDYAYRQLKLALGNGLLINEGEHWKKQRRLAQPAFYKKRLETLFQIMVSISQEYCDSLEAKRGEQKSTNMLSEMMHVTSKIVMETLLGSELGEKLSHVESNITVAQKQIVRRIRKPFSIPFTYLDGSHKEFMNNITEFDEFIFSVIDKRNQQPEKDYPDLLNMLMAARDEDGNPMDKRQLRDEVITIFVAGHETSANALSWALYLLSKHPEICKKLKTEITNVLGGNAPKLEDLRNLEYTKMVIDESMRLYPPAYAVGRENLEEDTILGYNLPKGSPMISSIWSLHRRPDIWEQPEAFLPERFAPDKVKQRSKWHYIPFGAGPRMCIGNHFAIMEIQILLVMLLQRFEFVLDESHPVIPEPLITLRPKDGLMMWVK